RERDETRLHLLPRGPVATLGHVLRHLRAQLRLVGEQAVLVARLVLARPPLVRVGLVRPADQTLEEREAAEHPARRVVGGEQRVLDPEAPQRVARLQAAGPAPDDDDVVTARWERPLFRYRQVFAPRTRRASAFSIRSMTAGCSSRNGSSMVSGTTRQRSSVSASTSALGGSPISTEISPKKSPRPRWATRTSATSTVAAPSMMM